MKKLSIISILLILVLFLFSFGYADRNGDLELSNAVNPTVVRPDTGSVTGTVSFTATNYNTTAPMTVEFESTQPTSGSNTLQTPTINSVTILAATGSSGTSVSVSFNVNVLSTTQTGTYSATISGVDTTNPANNATLSYNVVVQELNPSLAISGLDTNGDFLISAPDNSETTKSFSISNNGNVNLTGVQVKIAADTNAFTSGSKTISFKINGNTANLNTFYSLSPIGVGTSQTVNIMAVIPNNMDVDTYEGNITISTDYSGANATFPLLVRVEPEICSDGRRSDGNSVNFNAGNLRVTIDEPDSGDDFKQGDQIDVDVTVDNEDNNDMDVIVEAILYDVNDDNEIESVTSDSKEIKDGDEEDFNLELTVPYTDELDEDNNYILYIKAYEDGDEDKNCEYDGVDMDFKRESNEVIIDGFTITPTLLSCGDLVNFNVDVLNAGEKDEDDVYVKVLNNELGLDVESSKFDLEDYSGDAEATKSLSFTIPEDATEKDYVIEARVYYDEGDKYESAFGTLTVANCGITVIEEESVVSIAQTSFSIDKGELFTIPVTITNNKDVSQTYTIEFTPTGSWTSTVTETLTVNSGQSSTGYLYITPTASATGSQIGTVTVKQDGNIIKTQSINVGIETGVGVTPTGEAIYQPTGKFWEELTSNTLFWIIGDIILVILIVLVLFLIFRRR